jgi:hypothetical protein
VKPGILVLAILTTGLLFGCGGSDGDSSGSAAHVNEETGSTHGVAPDERDGIPPPPVKEANLKKAAAEAGCLAYLKQKDEGRDLVPPESPAPEYESDPPTSGDHVEPPDQQADGAYLEQPFPIDFVGSLEYGRMEIHYAPDLPEKIQRELKGLYDTMYGGVLMFPNSEMLYGVAASTWTNLLACPGWEGDKTLDAIRAFGKLTWGKYGAKSKEALAAAGPTPADPEESGASK